jgi:ammonia channel protein AmtB
MVARFQTFMSTVAGLVLITPISRFHRPYSFHSSLVVAALSYTARLGDSNSLVWHVGFIGLTTENSFATHCVRGMVGTIATGLSAEKEVAESNGATVVDGGVVFDSKFKAA